MTVVWSPHAESLLEDVVIGIARATSPDDGFHWEERLRKGANDLSDFPLSCPVVPLVCFREVPPNPERLRQLIVKPYRIVYETVENEVHVLSIRHGRMLVSTGDTYWN